MTRTDTKVILVNVGVKTPIVRMVGALGGLACPFNGLPCFPLVSLCLALGFHLGGDGFAGALSEPALTARDDELVEPLCPPFLDCVLIIPSKTPVVYSHFHQIGINIFGHFFPHFSLDILLGVCYNISGLSGLRGYQRLNPFTNLVKGFCFYSSISSRNPPNERQPVK